AASGNCGPRGGRGQQGRTPVPVRSSARCASLSDRGASRAGERRALRGSCVYTAVPGHARKPVSSARNRERPVGPDAGGHQRMSAYAPELRNEGVFTPPATSGSLHVPGNIGGLHWGGMAWDPAHRLLIAPVNHWPAAVRLLPRSELEEARRAFPTRETTEQDG